MKTKTELTNEKVLLALGISWQPKVVGRTSGWYQGDILILRGNVDPPDPLNDLNACFKYGVYLKISFNKATEIMAIAYNEQWSPEKTATALCEAFIEILSCLPQSTGE